MVSAEDGHYITDVRKIKFAGKDKGEFIADSSGMFFDPYGIVYIALNFLRFGFPDSDDGTIRDYAPRFAIGAYNVNT